MRKYTVHTCFQGESSSLDLTHWKVLSTLLTNAEGCVKIWLDLFATKGKNCDLVFWVNVPASAAAANYAHWALGSLVNGDALTDSCILG